MLNAIIQSISDSELDYVAGLDYGQDRQKHLENLRALIYVQNGIFKKEQTWFPYEVIELGAHVLVAGHEREFAICTLLVIQAVVNGFDVWTDLDYKFSRCATYYDMLPQQLRQEIVQAYEAAETKEP